MGLDMHACKTRERIDGETDFSAQQDEQLYYWRNHDHLNAWMMDLYAAKGGDGSNSTVMLDEDDLDELEAVLMAGALPFFGSRVSDAAMLPGDLEFVRLAREALAQGYTVFYFYW